MVFQKPTQRTGKSPHPQARVIVAAQYGHQAEKATELLKTWTARHPDDMTGLSQYGTSLRNGKRYDEAGEVYQKAIQIGAVGNDFYNLACAYSLLKEKEKALSALEQAVKLGYGSKQYYDSDSDLEFVRSDERYNKLFIKLN